jgi:dTDP-4-dehydrorhamnose reductase
MNILLFGSTGMLGRYVLNVLKNDFNVICIKKNDYDIENDSWEKLEKIIKNNLKENDIIINCSGIIPQKICKDNLKTYIRINTLFPHKLNEISQQINIKYIHITTDCVYDGLKGNYSIYDKHTACDIYGISKSLGEPENATIIRTSIIGEELINKKSLLEWIKSNKNGEINGYTNHYWNGVTCLTLANIIKTMIIDNNYWKGVKHVFSPNVVSKYELCCYINEIYDLNIKINKYEDTNPKNMTLTGGYFFVLPKIYEQINNLSKFLLS